jgi:hypothetical protein
VLVLSFTGFGYFPDFTPAHHDDFETGMIGGIAGTVGLPSLTFSFLPTI